MCCITDCKGWFKSISISVTFRNVSVIVLHQLSFLFLYGLCMQKRCCFPLITCLYSTLCNKVNKLWHQTRDLLFTAIYLVFIFLFLNNANTGAELPCCYRHFKTLYHETNRRGLKIFNFSPSPFLSAEDNEKYQWLEKK